MRKFVKEREDVDVVRFTTFFHQFTLQFDEYAREKFVDWFGYQWFCFPLYFGEV